MTRLTGMVILEVAAFVNVITILLVYVFTDSVLGATLAVMLPLASPLEGVTCSQFPPVTGCTDTVNPVLPPVAVKLTVWEAGVVAPWGCVKVSEIGDAATVVFAETINTTGIVNCPLGRFAL